MDRYAVLIMDAPAFPVEGPAMTERSPLTPVPKAAVDHLMDDDLVKSRCIIVEAPGDGQRSCPAFAEELSCHTGILPNLYCGRRKVVAEHLFIKSLESASNVLFSYLQGHGIC